MSIGSCPRRGPAPESRRRPGLADPALEQPGWAEAISGHRTVAVGGFPETQLYLPLYLVVSLVTGTFTIAAVSFVAGLLLTNIPLLAGWTPTDCPLLCWR